MTAALHANSPITAQGASGRKCLAFRLGDESYGIEVLKIREIFRLVFGIELDTPCRLGMAKIKGTVMTLLDIDRVMMPETVAPSGCLPETISTIFCHQSDQSQGL